jgi:hypothetical protein
MLETNLSAVSEISATTKCTRADGSAVLKPFSFFAHSDAAVWSMGLQAFSQHLFSSRATKPQIRNQHKKCEHTEKEDYQKFHTIQHMVVIAKFQGAAPCYS